MLSKRSLVIGLVLALLAIPGFVAGGTEATTEVQDVQIDVSRLSGRCTYWAPIPPWQASWFEGIEEAPEGDAVNVVRRASAPLLEHVGAWAEVIVTNPEVVGGYFACTDHLERVPFGGVLPCLAGPSHEAVSCFLRGEHLIMLKIDDSEVPVSGCIRLNVKGMRRAAVSSDIDGEPQPFYYLDPKDDAVQTVCGLGDGRILKLRLMSCPDVNGDHTVDLFEDIMGTAAATLAGRGDPRWNYLADHNEDGYVGLFDDLFTVAYRFGMQCDWFDY